LAFAAGHNIRPWIEEFPMNSEGLAKDFRAFVSGKIRYRAVPSTKLEGGDKL
jgi:hypothetical protein